LSTPGGTVGGAFCEAAEALDAGAALAVVGAGDDCDNPGAEIGIAKLRAAEATCQEEKAAKASGMTIAQALKARKRRTNKEEEKFCAGIGTSSSISNPVAVRRGLTLC